MLNRHYNLRSLRFGDEQLSELMKLRDSSDAVNKLLNEMEKDPTKAVYQMVASNEFIDYAGRTILEGTVGGILEFGTDNVAFDNMAWVDGTSCVLGGGLIRGAKVAKGSVVSGCTLIQSSTLINSEISPSDSNAAVISDSFINGSSVYGAAMICHKTLHDMETDNPLMML
jgi:hypothetical protein